MTATDGSHRGMRLVTLRYWAGARAAAGVTEETFEAGPRVGDVLDAAVAAHPALGDVPICKRCADKYALPVTPFEDDDDAGPDPVWHRYQ